MSSPPSPPPLKEVLEAAQKLPPFPDVVWKVMPLIQKTAPISEIESVIKYDPIITAKVLAFSQSPHFSRRHSISSLRDAIVFLGEQQLIQVIVTACSERYYAGQIPAGYDLREGELWEHAVSTALMTEIVGRRLGQENLFTAYTAALLHDIGKIVLSGYVESYFESILSLVKQKRMRFLDAEREVLGIDHQQLGVLISERWKLPPEVTTAIGFHHSPQQAEANRDLVALVYVSNRMVSALGIGCGVDGFLQPNQDEVFAQLGISPDMVDQFLADLVEAMKETKQFLMS
jgi:putative nucleotidyltransferase with HDIG domain